MLLWLAHLSRDEVLLAFLRRCCSSEVDVASSMNGSEEEEHTLVCLEAFTLFKDMLIFANDLEKNMDPQRRDNAILNELCSRTSLLRDALKISLQPKEEKEEEQPTNATILERFSHVWVDEQKIETVQSVVRDFKRLADYLVAMRSLSVGPLVQTLATKHLGLSSLSVAGKAESALPATALRIENTLPLAPRTTIHRCCLSYRHHRLTPTPNTHAP